MFRFAARNRVGFSNEWLESSQITTRKEGRPETPILSIQTGGKILIGDGIIELPRSEVYLLLFNLLYITESFNASISHHIFDYTITFVYQKALLRTFQNSFLTTQ